MAEVLQPQERSQLAQHLRRLTAFQLKLLATAVVIGVIGFGIYAMAEFNRPSAASVPAGRNINASPDVSAPSNGFVGGNSSTGSAAPPVETVAPAETWTGWSGAKGMKLGFGFVGGFVIGFIFRAFLKVMTLITMLIVGGLAALSHFNILHVDWAAAQTAYAEHSQWLTDHAIHLKDVLVDHLPSTTTGAAGVFFGTRRR